MVRLASFALLILALTGCATTQQEAARLRLNSARLRAVQVRLRVVQPNPEIKVQSVSLLASHGGSAIVVRLRNLVAHPVSDLPISVGVVAKGGHRVYLNGARDSDYFLSHVPGIPAGGVLTWVFTTRRSLAPSTRPFAAVGVASPPLVSGLRALPRIAISTGDSSRTRVRGVIHNISSVPQYGLQVYFVASRLGRLVGAGRATIAHLGAGATAAISISAVGKTQHDSVTLEAAPTIFG
ncbi:MAG: hypothetical protein ACXVUL_21780 [Solirubrobacteraceae bacterium]